MLRWNKSKLDYCLTYFLSKFFVGANAQSQPFASGQLKNANNVYGCFSQDSSSSFSTSSTACTDKLTFNYYRSLTAVPGVIGNGFASNANGSGSLVLTIGQPNKFIRAYPTLGQKSLFSNFNSTW